MVMFFQVILWSCNVVRVLFSCPSIKVDEIAEENSQEHLPVPGNILICTYMHFSYVHKRAFYPEVKLVGMPM